MFWNRKPYKVRPTGRAGLVYSEGERTVHIFSELLFGGEYDAVVYISRVQHWDSPNDQDRLAEDDIERIKKNLCNSFTSKIEWA